MPRINPALDLRALSREFARTGRIRVPSVLEPSFARKTLESLQGQVPWSLMYFDRRKQGKDVIGRVSAEQRAQMTDAEWQTLERQIISDAQQGYQSYYKGYDILDARRRGVDQELFLQQFLDFMGSDELFDFIRALSGDPLFNRVDCHACCYEPGHFLREHADQSPFERRRMAYVFNFSKDWEADYGGLTHFLDERHEVTETCIPQFNSMLLFRVPVNHSVSMVSSFAPRPRYSITGWFTHYS